MHQRTRKRSRAITLVLAGSATVAGCGSPVEQRDAYSTQSACVRDWGNAQLCEPVRDGRYSTSYFYGPPYYGNGTTYSLFGRTRSPRIEPSPNAMDAHRVQTGTVAASSTAALAMRTGAGPRAGGSGASTVRAGFGSSAHSSSSSSGG
ncbi:MAG: hypothetical protein IT513_09080 [Burkholderiales bacterium]|nr:hypothetical protein [Burkholderiales bacterium]